jgi:hypothetical protein
MRNLKLDLGVQFFPCLRRGDGNGNPEEQFRVSSSGFEQVVAQYTAPLET